MSGPGQTSVDELVAAGDYEAAAARAEELGDHLRAAELYERIWSFAAAAACAQAGGDLARALRNAIDAKDERLVGELATALDEGGEAGQRAAMEVFASRRRFGEAGERAEALDERERAVELYRQGHRDLDAARLLEDLGKDREAGRLLERVVAHGAGDPELAPAHLQLGLLLARRMQHDDAVRHLQEAARHAQTRAPAQRALIVELAALGLRDAARDVLVSARADDDSLPPSVDEIVAAERDDRIKPRQSEGEVQIIAARYRVERLLGVGGTGRVYLARDEVSGRRVAVKVFNTLHARGREAYERFVREARVAGALRHPNLVEVVDFSADQGFLVMEYMVGGSLADRLDPHLPERSVRRMTLDVLAGLELAHRRSIVHRDVKPPNIFFDARGTAKLGDFGVAHLLDLGQTQTGGLIGTLAYMSPEQITGAPLSFAADLYSLGVTLFQSLAGRLPFQGPDFVAQHLGEAPPLISKAKPGLHPAWDDVLVRLLAKSPTDRYESVDDLRRDITAIDTGVVATPLMLHRARAASADDVEPLASDDEVADAEAAPRYQYETALGRTEHSRLRRALDTALDRSVMIEQFDEGALDKPTEQRLYNLARGGGPFMQRALSYDREQLTAVFEAPAGAPLSEAFKDAPVSHRRAVRMLKRLARAVAPLHDAGAAHGALEPTRVVVDSHGHPTVLVCGLGPLNPEATPAADTTALIEMVTDIAGIDKHTGEGLVEATTEHLSAQEQAALMIMSTPKSGEQLYAFADAIEIAILKARARGL